MVTNSNVLHFKHVGNEIMGLETQYVMPLLPCSKFTCDIGIVGAGPYKLSDKLLRLIKSRAVSGLRVAYVLGFALAKIVHEDK